MTEETNVLPIKFGVDASDLPDQRGVRSVPFEAHLCLAEQCVHEEVTHLTDRILQSWLASRERMPKAEKQQQLAACVRLIIYNLLRAEARSEGMAVGISTSKQRLSESRRYNPPFMSVDYFLRARDLLLEHGIMYIAAPGYQNDGLAKVVSRKWWKFSDGVLRAV